MTRPRDGELENRLRKQLQEFDANEYNLPGIRTDACTNSFIGQLLESIHRVQYIRIIGDREISPQRLNPSSDLFDPIKGAILCQKRNEIDEAFWLVFLSVFFGKHGRDGWLRARDVYGALGAEHRWTWERVSENPEQFQTWHTKNVNRIRGRFGNHRKYVGLASAGEVVVNYVRWVAPPRTHEEMIRDTERSIMRRNPGAVFDARFRSLREVKSFGRLAAFDYLTMIGKLQLAQIFPASPYLDGATGPLAGARLLFGEWQIGVNELDQRVVQLGRSLDLGDLRMQVMEDALCNWQKSPENFRPFRG